MDSDNKQSKASLDPLDEAMVLKIDSNKVELNGVLLKCVNSYKLESFAPGFAKLTVRMLVAF